MKSYKFRIYPSKFQEKQINHHLWIAKNLWNELLEHSKETYRNFDKFPTRNSLQLMVKNTGLFSQTSQKIAHRVEAGIWRYVKLRKTGNKRAGFPRFRTINRMNSLHYSQFGFLLGENLKVTPFGEIPIVQHREIKGTIKTLTLKREASGKWFACFAVEETPIVKASNGKPRVGVDLGLKTLATFSDGRILKNPRQLRKHEAHLARLQQLLSRKKKGSRNRQDAKRKVAVAYEKVANTRKDFLQKATTSLVNSYSLIALEKLDSQEMSEQNFGKSINDAGWGMFTNMLRYKAESAGCEVVFVNPKNTTQECSSCHEIVKKDLTERMHNCPFCSLSIDRDLNAAYNILNRATGGSPGSNACEDVPKGTSVKQEANKRCDHDGLF